MKKKSRIDTGLSTYRNSNKVFMGSLRDKARRPAEYQRRTAKLPTGSTRAEIIPFLKQPRRRIYRLTMDPMNTHKYILTWGERKRPHLAISWKGCREAEPGFSLSRWINIMSWSWKATTMTMSSSISRKLLAKILFIRFWKIGIPSMIRLKNNMRNTCGFNKKAKDCNSKNQFSRSSWWYLVHLSRLKTSRPSRKSNCKQLNLKYSKKDKN